MNLRDLIVTYLDLQDIRTLCFYLGLDFDEFPRDLGKSGIVERLITDYYKANKLAELVAQGRVMRPDLTWPEAADLPTLGQALGRPLAPRLPFEPETIIIPAGPFWMGREAPAIETPRHEVTLAAYAIGRTAVTNAQYGVFIAQSNHRPPKVRGAGWLGRKVHNWLDEPVRGVSWEDALAYCAWLSAQTGRIYRLPTEAEWEKAARGTDGRLYPWGHAWDEAACPQGRARPSAVLAHPAGASPYGCMGMVGNVWEWTSSGWGDELEVPRFGYPYVAGDGREALHNELTTRRVLRGGAFNTPLAWLACTTRDRDLASAVGDVYGFRVVEVV